MFMVSMAEGKEGRAALCRILAIYSRYNPAVEYCQGMQFVEVILVKQNDY